MKTPESSTSDVAHFVCGERVDVSTESALYNDPWKIRKQLTKSDLGQLLRLLLPGAA